MSEQPRRTLDRPPSERYGRVPGEVRPGAHGGDDTSGPQTRAGARGARATPAAGAASWRPEVIALATGIVTALFLVLLGGVLALTSGQLIVAGVGGALLGLALAGSTRPARTRRWLAIGLAVAAVAVGAVGTWLLALDEGGSLGLVDFVWATTGLLVPAEALIAVIAAAWGLATGPITD